MIKLPVVSSPETHELCQEIAKKSKGTCLLMFSRGKDSLFAWLYLKKYFNRIIPFHCASHPGLKHVQETLDYYESILCDKAKGERILRMVGEELGMSLPRMVYQDPEYLDTAYELETPDFSKLDVLEFLRYKLRMPKVWCAVGINACDSIDRRIYCKKCGGKNDNNLTFYPTWNISKAEIIQSLKDSGVQLSGEYKWSNRTLGGVPSATCNAIYKEHYPEDWEKILELYPLAEAKNIREKYLDTIWNERLAAGIVTDEPEGDEEYSDGTDVMPEIGMGMELEGAL